MIFYSLIIVVMKRKAGRKLKGLEDEIMHEPEFDFDKIYSYQRKLELLCENARQKNTLEYFSSLDLDPFLNSNIGKTSSKSMKYSSSTNLQKPNLILSNY